MEQIVNLMMKLIKSEISGEMFDRTLCDDLTDENWRSLYQLSKRHDLAHLVGDAVLKNKLISDNDMKEKFEKQVFKAVYRYERINYELREIIKVLNEAQIPYIPLKGSVIRQYYPAPWMRTSCDIDILVHEDDLERAKCALTERLEYKFDSKGSHDIGAFSPSGVHLELHYKLIEDEIVGKADVPLLDIWSYASVEKDTYCFSLNDEMYFYYHIAHMAKHFEHGGCGVRPFIDLWVLRHSLPENKTERVELLERGGLLKFAEASEMLSKIWFDGAEYNSLTRQMEDYLLHGGVYGIVDNRVAVQQANKGSKFKYALSRIWLPYERLRFHYPSLENHRWLLPLYEVRRWFKLLLCGGVKRSVNELKVNAVTNTETRNQTTQMLSEIGLL